MTGRKSRNKGRRGEQELVRFFRERGYELQRVPNSGGLDIKGDLLGLEGFHLEAKRQEKINLLSWCYQAESESPTGDKPLVIFRKSNDIWRVVIRLEDFIDMLNVYYEVNREGKPTDRTVPDMAEEKNS